MSAIQIDRAHSLGLPAARQHARLWAQKAEAKFGVQSRYEEGAERDMLRFSGNGIEGELLVTGAQLKLQMQLGFMASMFKDQIEAKLRDQLDAIAGSTAA